MVNFDLFNIDIPNALVLSHRMEDMCILGIQMEVEESRPGLF
jgi:hypothetical protein